MPFARNITASLNPANDYQTFRNTLGNRGIFTASKDALLEAVFCATF